MLVTADGLIGLGFETWLPWRARLDAGMLPAVSGPSDVGRRCTERVGLHLSRVGVRSRMWGRRSRARGGRSGER